MTKHPCPYQELKGVEKLMTDIKDRIVLGFEHLLEPARNLTFTQACNDLYFACANVETNFKSAFGDTLGLGDRQHDLTFDTSFRPYTNAVFPAVMGMVAGTLVSMSTGFYPGETLIERASAMVDGYTHINALDPNWGMAVPVPETYTTTQHMAETAGYAGIGAVIGGTALPLANATSSVMHSLMGAFNEVATTFVRDLIPEDILWGVHLRAIEAANHVGEKMEIMPPLP